MKLKINFKMTNATSAGDTNSPTLHVMLGVPIYKHRRVGHDETVPLEQCGPEVLKKSCSTQLSMKFFLLINVKLPTIVGILTFMSRKKSIPGLFESKNS